MQRTYNMNNNSSVFALMDNHDAVHNEVEQQQQQNYQINDEQFDQDRTPLNKRTQIDVKKGRYEMIKQC